MGYLETTNSTKEIIQTGQENPKGLIGALALGALAVVGIAIKAIADADKK